MIFPRPSLLPLRPLAVAVALAATAFAAQAQNLLQLYEAARGYDATYLAVRAQTEAAQSRLAQAGALRLPTVGLGASSTRGGSELPEYEVTVTNPVTGLPETKTVPSSRGYGTVNQAAISARQPLYNKANSETIAQAEKAYEVATADLESAEQDLIVRLAQAYFDVLAAEDVLTTTRANKKAVTEALALAERSFQVGTATIVDTREAQSRSNIVSAQEIAALNDLANKRAALDTLVGRSNVTPRPFAQPIVIPPLVRNDVDEWLRNADADSPLLRRARLAFEIAQLETEKARAGHLPTLDVVGSLSTNHNSGIVGAGTGSGTIPGLFKNGSIGVQLNWPLFAGFAVQNRVKETVSLTEKARNDLDGVRRSVSLGTRQAFFGVASGRALVTALEAAESSSKLALEATEVGFRVGVRVALDVLNAQTTLYQTQRDLAKARYDLVNGSFRLYQASGQLGPNDVAAVNRLLAP
ncbi:MAG TPA: TolC family outer membrane protein [Burkholderiaceae bacterium]|nr:TolC family outer membrane protein [Burkholderiaceae bacterium]